ncbi:antibiotic biosynthesis monooxygenase [Lichenihabitans sp. PAMC28606]|uniref:putative quinol monooxygenase n=1 Tax=Lichenihabitans sp. PAMC28606 TaxID=2880932 RepID=UPI001D0A2D08|nr:putative quinol monooxygenase [Lichenihabitans sp. PAMC28606]UDL95811.1 antibiotic biosynthesis monooxygenase [Lichenihabitans sp. PAMC28606]
MSKFAFLIEMKAKPGKEAEVEAFLAKEASLVKDEPGTLTWHGSKVEGEPGVYRVFDSFPDEAAGEAHMAGPPGQEFVERAPDLFAETKVLRLQVVAFK